MEQNWGDTDVVACSPYEVLESVSGRKGGDTVLLRVMAGNGEKLADDDQNVDAIQDD